MKFGIVMFLAAMGLSGCASVTPQSNTANQTQTVQVNSVDQQIAFGYGAISTIRMTAANALQGGTLSLQDAQNVLSYTDQARTLLDQARAALGQGQAVQAQTLLTSVTSLLTEAKSLIGAK